MKKNRPLKIIIALIVVIALIFLIKSNVTLSKEPSLDDFGNSTNKVLEINSDLVQNLYSKLTLLEDTFLNENYKFAYFKMNSDEKELSPEEKFYITLEHLYEAESLNTTKEDGVEKLTTKAEDIIDEANKLFPGSEIDAKNINFAPMSKCGITEYLFTGNDYEFTFTICTEDHDITEDKLLSARKEGNFIVLRIQAFYAKYFPKTKKEKEDHYVIKNYNSDEELAKINKSEIQEELEHIIENYTINSYDFYFELKGDDYYLFKIAKVN